MAIRVLGYKTVVEAKGTWPTNYIAKATELKVLDDVKYGKYTDGATRGNVALLMWNMLTTNMWDVKSENENTGLTYEATGITMIDKYFENYLYIDEEAEIVVTDINVLDGKVTVSLESVAVDDEGDPIFDKTFELAKDVDFLNLFGRTVSVLYNEKEEKVVMIIPSNEDEVVEAYTWELAEEDYTFADSDADLFFWGYGEDSGDVELYSYMVNTIERRKEIDTSIVYNVSGAVVDEIKETSSGIRFTFLDDVDSLTIDEEAIVLIDGKWAAATDIEAGDVLSVLKADELFIVSRNVVEGEFEAIEEKTDMDNYIYNITVDGEEYDCISAWVSSVVEVDEDGEDLVPVDLEDILLADKDADEYRFYGEDCRVFFNAIGEIVRIEFAEITDTVKGNFYVATNCPEVAWNVTDKNGTTTYIELNGESYEVKSPLSGDAINTLASGDILLVEFDSKDRVKEIRKVSTSLVTEDYRFDAVVSGDNGEILDDYNYVSGDKEKYKVTASTVVYTITPVKDEENEDITAYYEVEISKGPSALEGVESAIVAIEFDDAFDKAAYVFVTEEAKNTEKTFGLVEEKGTRNGVPHVTISGVKFNKVDEDSVEYYVNELVSFVENDGTVKITRAYYMDMVNDLSGDNSVIVDKVQARVATMKDKSKVDLDTKDKAYEDAKIYVANITLKDYDNVFESVEEVSYADMRLKAGDILYEDLANDIVIIFRGYDFDI